MTDHQRTKLRAVLQRCDEQREAYRRSLAQLGPVVWPAPRLTSAERRTAACYSLVVGAIVTLPTLACLLNVWHCQRIADALLVVFVVAGFLSRPERLIACATLGLVWWAMTKL